MVVVGDSIIITGVSIFFRMFAHFIYNQHIINTSDKTMQVHVLRIIYFLVVHWTLDSLIKRILSLLGTDFFPKE